MPRKTKKQKLRARKKRAILEPVKREFSFNLGDASALPRVPKRSDKSLRVHTTSLAVGDLVKTVLLAVGVFSLEIVIYFAWFREV